MTGFGNRKYTKSRKSETLFDWVISHFYFFQNSPKRSNDYEGPEDIANNTVKYDAVFYSHRVVLTPAAVKIC